MADELYIFPVLSHLPVLPGIQIMNHLNSYDCLRIALTSPETRTMMRRIGRLPSINTLSAEELASMDVLDLYYFFQLESSIGTFQNSLKPITTVDIQVTPEGLGFTFTVAGAIHTNFKIFVEDSHQQCNYNGLVKNVEFDKKSSNAVLVNRDTMYTFWRKKRDGFTKLANHFKRTFNFDLDQIFISGSTLEAYSPNLKHAIKWMTTHVENPEVCRVTNGQNISNSDFQFIVQKMRKSRLLRLTGKEIPRFRLTARMESEDLSVNPAQWFKVENMIATNCESITLDHTTWTNLDFRNVVVKWTTGGFDRLILMRVQLTEDANLPVILQNIEAMSRDPNNQMLQVDIEWSHNDGQAMLNREDGAQAQLNAMRNHKIAMIVFP